MNRWPRSGNLLFLAAFVVETIVVFSIGAYPLVESIVIAGVLLTVPAFVVSYFVGQFGTFCGLVLGVMPAIFALSQLPTEVIGFSPLTGAVVLFIAFGGLLCTSTALATVVQSHSPPRSIRLA